jgi:hypothetical protein
MRSIGVIKDKADTFENIRAAIKKIHEDSKDVSLTECTVPVDCTMPLPTSIPAIVSVTPAEPITAVKQGFIETEEELRIVDDTPDTEITRTQEETHCAPEDISAEEDDRDEKISREVSVCA